MSLEQEVKDILEAALTAEAHPRAAHVFKSDEIVTDADADVIEVFIQNGPIPITGYGGDILNYETVLAVQVRCEQGARRDVLMSLLDGFEINPSMLPALVDSMEIASSTTGVDDDEGVILPYGGVTTYTVETASDPRQEG